MYVHNSVKEEKDVFFCIEEAAEDRQLWQLQEAAANIRLLLFRELFLSGTKIHGGDVSSSILRVFSLQTT